MKVALIGLGVIGEVHLQVLNELGVELSAVCDVDEGKLKDFTCAKYTDYKKMLTEIKPNVVHVCTPHYLHADMVVYALNLGINVLCEKPLGISEQDLERILKAEENSTAKLGVCMQNRYLPEILYLKNQLENADKKY
ncbi:MAG: Gfo/Idh/MocA family oxidoreductase, partial [Clostridia bacterium]|nr:Gfo/Idh/MocA family oxidoreductase [Clostridia bacterium]